MRIEFDLDDQTAKVLAMVLWSAEDSRRRVRTNDDHPLNVSFTKLNAIGEDLGRRLGLDPELGDEQDVLRDA